MSASWDGVEGNHKMHFMQCCRQIPPTFTDRTFEFYLDFLLKFKDEILCLLRLVFFFHFSHRTKDVRSTK